MGQCCSKDDNEQPPTNEGDSEVSTHVVWVYEDIDEQWKEFRPDIQAMLEDDYSNGCDSSTWPKVSPNERQHTVHFKTQPMTYMVTYGDAIKLSTVVERREVRANGRCVLVSLSSSEDERNTITEVDVMSESDSSGPSACGASYDDGSNHDNSKPIVVHNTTERPSDKPNRQQQDDDTAINQSANKYPSPTYGTIDIMPSNVFTSQPSNKPSANRKNPSNPPSQSGDSKEPTPCSLSQQLSEDSHVIVKADDNVAMTTNYTWDSNIPPYWAPMDGSRVKIVVLHPTDSEYQLVADTFVASLGNTLATVIQIERIQNPTLHSKYMHNKDIMDKNNPPATKNEQHLWHGITVTMTQHGPMPVTAINACGFNRSFTASSSGEAVYGNGTYFAVEARKSLQYSNPDVNDHRHMYWCRVLTGEYTRGRTNLIVAPVKTAGTYDLYDSVVDIVESPTMFVIFEDAHAYPEYLITFM